MKLYFTDHWKQIALWSLGVILVGTFAYSSYYKNVTLPKEELKLKQRIEEEKNALEREEREKKEKQEKINTVLLNTCLESADEEYWNYVKLNMEEKKDGTYWGLQYQWDNADAKKKVIEDRCFKQYKR